MRMKDGRRPPRRFAPKPIIMSNANDFLSVMLTYKSIRIRDMPRKCGNSSRMQTRSRSLTSRTSHMRAPLFPPSSWRALGMFPAPRPDEAESAETWPSSAGNAQHNRADEPRPEQTRRGRRRGSAHRRWLHHLSPSPAPPRASSASPEWSPREIHL